MADGDTNTAQASSGGGAVDIAKPGKAAKPDKPVVTQDEATQAPARCPKTGMELDQFGLPTNGVFRAAKLAELGIEDPALKPTPETETTDD